MSAARKQLRTMRRKLAMKGVSDETAQKVIDAANIHTARVKAEIANDVTENLLKKRKADIRAEAMGELIIMLLAYEHIDNGHTGDWLRQYLKKLWSFVDAVESKSEGKLDLAELKQILLDECDFDVAKEFAECANLSREGA